MKLKLGKKPGQEIAEDDITAGAAGAADGAAGPRPGGDARRLEGRR